MQCIFPYVTFFFGLIYNVESKNCTIVLTFCLLINCCLQCIWVKTPKTVRKAFSSKSPRNIPGTLLILLTYFYNCFRTTQPTFYFYHLLQQVLHFTADKTHVFIWLICQMAIYRFKIPLFCIQNRDHKNHIEPIVRKISNKTDQVIRDHRHKPSRFIYLHQF